MRRILGAIAVGLVAIAATAEYGGQFSPGTDTMPAYHLSAPKPGTALPPILAGNQLTGPNFMYPFQVTAYKMAARVGNVLYQEPCHCRCDRGMGHQSLRSCFEGLHGAECSTCMKEGVYTYEQTRAGKSAAQIRAGIERGEYMNIDLEKIHL